MPAAGIRGRCGRGIEVAVFPVDKSGAPGSGKRRRLGRPRPRSAHTAHEPASHHLTRMALPSAIGSWTDPYAPWSERAGHAGLGHAVPAVSMSLLPETGFERICTQNQNRGQILHGGTGLRPTRTSHREDSDCAAHGELGERVRPVRLVRVSLPSKQETTDGSWLPRRSPRPGPNNRVVAPLA
jgi:hypothetical protein